MRDPNQPLHIKYRPQSFNEVIGNEATIEALKTVIQREKGEVRTFLFTGPSGCGKTTIARIIANELECSDRDFSEFNSSNTRGIDTIREIANNSRYAPMTGKVKIYLLDEAHKLTSDAQNALLKLLEDTPAHVRFILCTTDPDKLIKTIKTRCSTFNVSSLKMPKIRQLLKWVCLEEKVIIPELIIQKIAESCDGSPRQSLVMLDQVIDIENDNIALQVIIDSTINEQNILDLCRSLIEKGNKWKDISQVINNLDEEPEKVRLAVMGYFSKVLINNPSDRIADIMLQFSEPFLYGGRGSLILACYLANKI